MSALFELLGGVLGEIMSPGGDDHLRGRGAVYLDGRWEEGELFFGPTKVIWNEQIIFSPQEGRVEKVTDDDEAWQVEPNLVVLHFRRAHDTVLLALHPKDLEQHVSKVLELPEIG
ncbi:hypothetical protein BBK82_15190 [Lentzea guizhouensis]|uniref:Uncharacterized protein n=1 Tax=Lentzea guizhouensis TaxID=1586287 RepID=A0A1B2HHM3_9PSEU|nr:hypothetical protein [Lentzea guizhouensis]ANZ37210.1 hypothetical protein BBK82_15190 [Lentzea guizhouensis]